jgi:hypothetical protein
MMMLVRGSGSFVIAIDGFAKPGIDTEGFIPQALIQAERGALILGIHPQLYLDCPVFLEHL